MVTISWDVNFTSWRKLLRFAILGRVIAIEIESTLSDHFCRNIFSRVGISLNNSGSWSRGGKVLSYLHNIDFLWINACGVVSHQRGIWGSEVMEGYLWGIEDILFNQLIYRFKFEWELDTKISFKNKTNMRNYLNFRALWELDNKITKDNQLKKSRKLKLPKNIVVNRNLDTAYLKLLNSNEGAIILRNSKLLRTSL